MNNPDDVSEVAAIREEHTHPVSFYDANKLGMYSNLKKNQFLKSLKRYSTFWNTRHPSEVAEQVLLLNGCLSDKYLPQKSMNHTWP